MSPEQEDDALRRSLTPSQIRALVALREAGGWTRARTAGVRDATMEKLKDRGMVKCLSATNGLARWLVWALTDDGARVAAPLRIGQMPEGAR